MDGPVDYFSGLGVLADPLKAMQDQLAFRVGLAQKQAQVEHIRAQVTEAAQKQQRSEMFQRDLAAVGNDPNAGAVSGLIMKYPEFGEQLKAGWGVKDKAAQQADLTQLGELYSAAASGNWDLAHTQAQARVDADKASGNADPGDEQFLAQIDAAAGGDEAAKKAVLTTIGTHLAAVTGPEHFGSVYGALKGGFHIIPEGGIAIDDNGQTVARSPYIKAQDGTIFERDPDAPPGGVVPADHAPVDPGGFDHAVATVLSNEGGYNPSDMNGAPVNFGINQKANPGVDVKNLTRDQAKQIYHDKYWVPSGAELLPANMQTPYFDTYIRNPKIAQRALVASGGDPAKFMDITDNYFQTLAKKANGQKYAKAWAARDANNRAIATGGTPAAASSAPSATASPAAPAGYHVLVPGSANPDQYQTLTPDEVKASGRDPNKIYQKNTKTGQITESGNSSGDDSIPGNPNLSGPAYLSTVPKNLATQVRALAEGRLPMPSSFALAKPYWQKLLQMTAQYDPAFDATAYPARKAAITAFTGMGKGAQVVSSVNRVANHLNTLWGENKKLAGPETGWSVTNKLLATAGQSFEPADAKAYDTAVGFVAGELEKIARNSPGTEAGVDRVIQSLGRRNSAKTRESAIKAAVDIISGAIDPLKEQYNSAFTNDSTRPRIPWVTPKAQKVYETIGGTSGTPDLSLTGASADTNGTNDSLPAGAKVVGTYQGKRVIEVNGRRMVEQ